MKRLPTMYPVRIEAACSECMGQARAGPNGGGGASRKKEFKDSKIIPYLVFCVIVSRETVKD